MKKILKEISDNAAYTNTAMAFQKQEPGTTGDNPLDGDRLPDSVTVLENGNVALTLYAPNAKTVTAGLMEREQFPLIQNDNGIWEGVLPFPGYGLRTLDWHVDGNRVLNPNAPVYFSYARPVNYVDIPDPEMDYILENGVPHGSVVIEYFQSQVTGNCERCFVYLPPDYEKSDLDYPVLYLQHGGLENEGCWVFNGKVNFIMDNLLAWEKAIPCIIVMCNGSIRLPQEGIFDFQGVVDMLRNDCIPYIERKYRVRKEKWGRAMAGLSMGSMQTSIRNYLDIWGCSVAF
ncbi:MAG: hypothetical protein HDR24_11020 [Lachnospiraceae bacterium]|nr:hypothetical protein [Lachnospiraceae bacterium]